MRTITERLKALISRTLLPENKFKSLEQLTGISGGTWRTWWNRNSKPSGEMIEAIAKQWPECAFWLVTGIDDADHGHISEDMMALLGEKNRPLRKYQREQAARLFATLIEMNQYEEPSAIPAELIEKERHLRRIRGAEEKLLTELEQSKQITVTE